MKEYCYIGVAEDLQNEVKYLVKSYTCPIHEESIVVFTIGGATICAEVLKASFLRVGGEEEAMLAEFGDIHEVEKIYDIAWDKKKGEEKNGN